MLYFCSTIDEYKTLKAKLKFKSLGFVPTMGSLHAGHLSLLRQSIDDNALSIISIFVNPKQFGKGEDFEEYPRTLEEDLQKIESTLQKLPGKEETVIAFTPKTEEEIFPKGFDEHVHLGKAGRTLEGDLRPEHFDGVATAVKRLLKIIRPDRAYFGKKDYQQLVLIKKMVKEEGLKVKVVGMPIVRDSSGLALSSRNVYLSEKEKEKALNLRKALLTVQKTLDKQKDLKAAQELVQKELKGDSSFNYLAIKDAETLEEPKDLEKPLVVLGNYQVNKTRLLDNVEVDIK